MRGKCIAAQRVSGRILAYSIERRELVVLTLREAAAALPAADFARVASERDENPQRRRVAGRVG